MIFEGVENDALLRSFSHIKSALAGGIAAPDAGVLELPVGQFVT